MIFQTERLFVRKWTPDDAAAAFRMYGDPVVMRYLGGGGKVQEKVDDARASLERIQARYEEVPRFGYWAMQRRDDGEIVGTLLLKPLPNSEKFEVGWHLAQQFWGHGYATEAARRALQHGFEDWDLDTIYAVLFTENTKSRAICERLGMAHQGRTTEFYDLDLELFSLARDDWRSQANV